MTVEELLREMETLKEEIENAKREKAELTGRFNEQMKTLATFGLTSIEEAEKFVKEESKEVEKLKESIFSLFDELKAEYEW